MLTAKRMLPLMGGVLTACLIIARLAASAADSQALSSWVSNPSLNLQKQANVAALPTSGNVDCYMGQNNVCVNEVDYGEADTQGNVRLRNSNSFYPVYSYIDARKHFLAIPDSSGFLTYTTEPVYGAYLYYNYDFVNSAKLVPDGASYDYQIYKPPDGKISDSNQNRLAADTSSLGFSGNGDWMVFSSPNIGLYRVNLRTLETLRFATGFNYTIGLSPAPQTAITNDGRYASVASKDFGSFKLYDLAACAAGSLSDCQYRDLTSILSSQIKDFYAVSNLRFIDDDSLAFYASSYSGGKYSFARYVISPSGSISRQDLLGLGDSYISGEGEFEYLPGTDDENNHCHLSALSYPLLLGSDLSYDSYHSVACSGATTNDVINTGAYYAGQSKPKLERRNRLLSEVDSTISNFSPGYIDQLDFVKQYQPKSIVLSVGGNDVDMIGKLKTCIKSGTCYSTYEDRLEFVKDVDNVFPRLVSTYQKLKIAGPPDMRIYVVAYPQIAKPGGDCALNVRLDADEVAFTAQAISYLDSTIKAAAARAGVFYVDTEDALFGHRFCEAGPGSVAMNGVTAGNDIPSRFDGPIGSESFHPNQFGHLLLENKILELTQNLSLPMPAADLSANLPSTDASDILDAPTSGRAVNLPEYDPGLAPELAYAGTAIDISSVGSDHSFAAGTQFQTQLHSDPIDLGDVAVGADGNINTRLTIPADTPAGYHVLHLYGKDLTSQAIDIYKDIYIAKTADDLDGDGVADSIQRCVGIEPSGQDYDKDGIDDACDGSIAEPPTEPPANASVSGSFTATIATINPTVAKETYGSSDKNLIGSAPKVLGSTTGNSIQNTSAKNSNLYIQPKYYVAGGGGFVALSGISYFFKRRWYG